VVAALRPPSPSERRARGSHESHNASSPPDPPLSTRRARALALMVELKSQRSTVYQTAKYTSLFLTRGMAELKSAFSGLYHNEICIICSNWHNSKIKTMKKIEKRQQFLQTTFFISLKNMFVVK